MIAVNTEYIIKVQRVFIKRIEIFLHSNSLLSSSATLVFKGVPKQTLCPILSALKQLPDTDYSISSAVIWTLTP